MPAYRFSSSAFGDATNNLVEALYGDPLQDVQAGLLGARRLQAEREADQLALETQIARRQEADLQAAYADPGRRFAAGSARPDLAADMARTFAGIDAAATDPYLAALMFDPRALTPDFSPSAARADAVSARNAGEAESLQGVRNTGLEAVANIGAGADVDVARVNAGADMYDSRLEGLVDLLTDGAGSGSKSSAGSAGTKPLSPTQYNSLLDLLAESLADSEDALQMAAAIDQNVQAGLPYGAAFNRQMDSYGQELPELLNTRALPSGRPMVAPLSVPPPPPVDSASAVPQDKILALLMDTLTGGAAAQAAPPAASAEATSAPTAQPSAPAVSPTLQGVLSLMQPEIRVGGAAPPAAAAAAAPLRSPPAGPSPVADAVTSLAAPAPATVGGPAPIQRPTTVPEIIETYQAMIRDPSKAPLHEALKVEMQQFVQGLSKAPPGEAVAAGQ